MLAVGHYENFTLGVIRMFLRKAKNLAVFLSIVFSALSAKAQDEKLFHGFVRSAASLGKEEVNEVKRQFQKSAQYVRDNAKWLEVPEGLMLVVSDDLLTSVYRGNEIVVPYRFVGQSVELVNEVEEELLVHPWRDYFFAMALFDRNMKIDHPLFKVYYDSYKLAKKQKRLQVYLEEDAFLESSDHTADELGSIYGENFNENKAAAQQQLAEVEAQIKAQSQNKQLNEVTSYVHYFYSAVQYLFADLFVAIKYNRDPDLMKKILYKIPAFIAQHRYRSFASDESIDSEWSRWDNLRDPFLFYPLREQLWNDLVGSNDPKELTEEKLFLGMENVFLRLRLTFKEVLDEMQKKIYPEAGRYQSLGNTYSQIWANLDIRPGFMFEKLNHSMCQLKFEKEFQP